jgi:hypothetical protein
VDLGSRNHIYNSFESFDLIEPLNKSISVANSSSISIIGQGPITLLYKWSNGTSPYLLQLKNVYFILDCTVNLVSTFQLGLDSIAFNLEVPYLKAFGLTTEALYSISQINRHYVLNAIPSLKPTFMEHMSLNRDIYLILSPLEHSLLL